MKREIKFRGISVETKEFIYGHLMCHKNFIEEKYYIKEGSKNPIVWKEVKSETVGQFTGLHDKNGTPVFEGDVLRWPQNREQYNDRYWQFYKVEIPKIFYSWEHEDHLACNQVEIIGNIHETP